MKKSLIIFYCLLVYASAELIWWGILLTKAEPNRKGMIIGEASVFLLIFLIGTIQLHRTLNKEHQLHLQQKNFLLSVTHELKSPLASIKLYLQTILKRDLKLEQQQAFIRNSLKDLERLDDLVENMLIATRIENNSYSFPKEVLNLSELVKKMADRLQGHTNTASVRTTEVENNITVNGDRFALSSAISNLIENAIKYTPLNETIFVKLYQDQKHVYFEVADQGAGIPDHEKSRIFDKFYRIGNEHTRKAKGTGLGLYIVKQVLKKHHAQIKVRDNKPRGSIFEIIFNKHAG
ncbi:MAG: HAMP domain-containing sensor histidine kinase [Sphingobacteriaceae bacterium]|jgi:signal transduction histidine kinase|nr:MAG: GHKL domain-containing protein [Pedobacter sp.]